MASLNQIELFLNIQIGDKVLRDGLKKKNKNKFYYYVNQYYIVQLNEDKWMILTTGERSIDILVEHIWGYSNGYAITNIDKGDSKSTTSFHIKIMDMNMDNDMYVDHINIRTYDNRIENLRYATAQDNCRNKKKRLNKITGNGIYKSTQHNVKYWIASINDNNNHAINKRFSIKKLGDEEAKNQAIAQRQIWKNQFGYLGE